jgi:hypothetical protein
LITAVGADPTYFEQLLRAAVAVGMLTRDESGRFALTPVGRIFCVDSSWQARVHDAWHTHPAVWQAFGALEEAVRQGRPAFEIVHNTTYYEYLKGDPELAMLFHGAMATNSTANNGFIIAGYDFSRFGHIVDCGGGNGTLLSAILAANPHARGTLFDTASDVLDAPSVLGAAGVSQRCDIVAGNFFESLPTGADAYLLKNVLHDWNDGACRKILGNCRSAMSGSGRVIVLGSVIPEPGTVGPAEELAVAIQEIGIMAICPGAARTVAEYEKLFEGADLKLAEVTPLHDLFFFYAIEGVPA